MQEIEIGDKVTVTLFMSENIEKSFNGTIMYIPQNMQYRDYWVILDDDNNLRYLKTFIQIIKYNK